MVYHGVTVTHPPRSGLWIAHCDRTGCNWHSQKRIEYSDAERAGYEHFKVKHQYDEWKLSLKAGEPEAFGFTLETSRPGAEWVRAVCLRGCGHMSAWVGKTKHADKLGHEHQLRQHRAAYLAAPSGPPTNLVRNPHLEVVGDGIVVGHFPNGRVMIGVDPAFKEQKMKTRQQIDDELELAQARLEHLLAEKRKIDKLPLEPFEDGTIVKFDIRFHGSDVTSYTYAAIRAIGAWWITGREQGGRTWHALLEFMAQDYRIQNGAGYVFEKFSPGEGILVNTEES